LLLDGEVLNLVHVYTKKFAQLRENWKTCQFLLSHGFIM